ncbi:cytochrome P450 [Lophium mytilinum]|uniref:Cytochrome P450 n=1 Tax=Lophium mytilinum TaxID=390894 RepID=A0A6A6RG15_9PEZI|nr:cytochrome P450 [Lophium mytilinum]
MAFTFLSALPLVPTILILTAGYMISFGVYRIFFSPISHIPGPWQAKVTFWYEFYYDVIVGGQYMFEIFKMHEKYGPVVRITPHEVHIADPDFYDQVYAGGTKRRDKPELFSRSGGVPESVFGTSKHELHRLRRAALNPFFSKAKVRALQPQMQKVIETFLMRLRTFQYTGQPMSASLGFAALSNDIAVQYAFGRNDNRTEAEDFAPSFHNASLSAAKSSKMIKIAPWIFPAMQMLPDSITVKVNPDMASYLNLQRGLRTQITRIRGDFSASKFPDNIPSTIFHSILANPDLPASEKSTFRLGQEGQVTVFAGTVTTAQTLSWAIYYLISQPSDLRRLKEELLTAIPNPCEMPLVAELESLPMLTACIQESLRLSHGFTTRLPREAPDEALVFDAGPNYNFNGDEELERKSKHWVIPPGTPMSTITPIIHWNERIFPEPYSFVPQRWIENPRLDRYLVSFNKGTRACVGINLAYSEMALTLASVFRRYGARFGGEETKFEGDEGVLELWETSERDVRIVTDATVPTTWSGSQGVRIKVTE